MRLSTLLLLGLCTCLGSHVVILGLSVKLSWYPMWLVPWLLWCRDCDACVLFVCVGCEYAERVLECEADGNPGMSVGDVWLW